MTFTQEELDKLAVFAGLKVRTQSVNADLTEVLRTCGFYWLADKQYCAVTQWHPNTNPAHGDLVLKALVKDYDLEIESFGGWTVTAWQKCSKSNTADARAEASVLWEAVCRGALEVSKGEKDG